MASDSKNNLKIGTTADDKGIKKLENALKSVDKVIKSLAKSMESFKKTSGDIDKGFLKSLDKSSTSASKLKKELEGINKAAQNINKVSGQGFFGRIGSAFANKFGNRGINTGGPNQFPGTPGYGGGPYMGQGPGGGGGGPGGGGGGGGNPGAPAAGGGGWNLWTPKQGQQNMQVISQMFANSGAVFSGAQSFKNESLRAESDMMRMQNQMFSRLMGGDISDLAAFHYANKDKNKPDILLGGSWGGNRKMSTISGGDSLMGAGNNTLPKLNTFTSGASNIAAGAGTLIGGAATGNVSGVTNGATAMASGAVSPFTNMITMGAQREAATAMQEALSERKQGRHMIDIGLMQNVMSNSGMLAQSAQRFGGGDLAAASGGIYSTAARRSTGMGVGEAVSTGIGLANQFGQGMARNGGLFDFGAEMQARGGLGAGVMGQAAGMAGGFGGGGVSNKERAQEGVKRISEAVSAGLEKGIKDPQTLEILARATAEGVTRSGRISNGAMLARVLTTGMDADSANPQELERRMRGIQSLSDTLQTNPYLKNRGMAAAAEFLGPNADLVKTSALSGASLSELIQGGGELETLGLKPEQTQEFARSQMRKLAELALSGGGESSQRLRQMTGNNAESAWKGKKSRELMSAILKQTVGQMPQQWNELLSGGEAMSGLFGSNPNSPANIGLIKKKLNGVGSAGVGAQGAAAASQLQALSDILGNKERMADFTATLESWRQFQNDVTNKKMPADASKATIELVQELEKLVETLDKHRGATERLQQIVEEQGGRAVPIGKKRPTR